MSLDEFLCDVVTCKFILSWSLQIVKEIVNKVMFVQNMYFNGKTLFNLWFTGLERRYNKSNFLEAFTRKLLIINE